MLLSGTIFISAITSQHYDAYIGKLSGKSGPFANSLSSSAAVCIHYLALVVLCCQSSASKLCFVAILRLKTFTFQKRGLQAEGDPSVL